LREQMVSSREHAAKYLEHTIYSDRWPNYSNLGPVSSHARAPLLPEQLIKKEAPRTK